MRFTERAYGQRTCQPGQAEVPRFDGDPLGLPGDVRQEALHVSQVLERATNSRRVCDSRSG